MIKKLMCWLCSTIQEDTVGFNESWHLTYETHAKEMKFRTFGDVSALRDFLDWLESRNGKAVTICFVKSKAVRMSREEVLA